MNVVIIGQGAMGLLWYHHIFKLFNSELNFKNSKIHLLPSNAKNLTTSKPTIQPYIFIDKHKTKYNGAISFAQENDIKTANLVFLCVKSFQVSNVLTSISTNIAPNASIILGHNGMGTLNNIPQELLNNHNIYTLLTTHGCLRTSPYNITHTGMGTSDLGLLSGLNNSTQQDSITQLLDSALPSVTFHDAIKKKQWEKLAVNCVINPLTSIHDIDNGELNKPKYAATITKLLEEIIVIAKAEDIALNFNLLENKVKKVALATANNCSSMRCDILAKRQSEIDYINGYIHVLGLKHNLATPMNTKMWETVKGLA